MLRKNSKRVDAGTMWEHNPLLKEARLRSRKMKGPYPDTTNCVPERERHTHDVKFSRSFSRSSTVKENHGYVLITSMLMRQASNQTS